MAGRESQSERGLTTCVKLLLSNDHISTPDIEALNWALNRPVRASVPSAIWTFSRVRFGLMHTTRESSTVARPFQVVSSDRDCWSCKGTKALRVKPVSLMPSSKPAGGGSRYSATVG